MYKNLVDSYVDVNESFPSSWTTYDTDLTKVNEQHKQICHANMAFDEQPGKDVLLTACPKTDDLSIKYIEFLMRGPFRAFQDKISFVSCNDKPIIRVDDLDQWPANVLFNFCVATRVPIEHRSYLKLWGKLVKSGVDENVAAAIGFYYANDAVNIPIRNDPLFTNQHFYFDMNSKLSNIVHGTFTTSADSYKMNPEASKPSNGIWGFCTPEDRELIKGKTPAELCEVFKVSFTPPKERKIKVEELEAAKAAGVNPLNELHFEDVIFNNGPIPQLNPDF